MWRPESTLIAMNNLKLTIAVFVVGGLGALWWQHSFNRGLRRDNAVLKGALAELKQSQEIREPIAAGESLTREQLDELLKVRGEVTRLRQETNQLGALTDANQKLDVEIIPTLRRKANRIVPIGVFGAPTELELRRPWLKIGI